MIVNKKSGLPLFYRFLITFSSVIMVIGGILTGVYYVYSKASVEKTAREIMIQQFESIHAYFEDEFSEELGRELRILASNPILDSYMMSSELDREINARNVERLFIQMIHYMDGYESISFLDHSGREKIRVSKAGREKQYRNLKGNTLFTRVERGAPGSIHTYGPLQDPERGTFYFYVGIAKIDADIGKFGGAVIIQHSLTAFLEQLDRLKILGENPIWAFTHDGRTLRKPSTETLSFDPRAYFINGLHAIPEVLNVDEGILVYQDLAAFDNRSMIRVAASAPSSLILRDVQEVFRFLSLVFIISLFLIFLIAYSLARYLSRPVIELARAATRLAKGDLSTQVRVQTSGEVQLLVDSFNQMAQDLEKTTVSKAYVDNIIRSMTDALIVASTDGKIKTINHAACTLLGYRENELIGRQITKIFGSDTEGSRSFDEKLLYGLVKNAEYSYLASDGRKVPVLVSSSAIYANDATPQGIVCVAVDITERKRTEEKLRIYASEIEQANEELKTFTYTVSHDLRAPLLNIVGFSKEFKYTIQEGREFLKKYVPSLSEEDKKIYTTIFEHDMGEAVEFIGASVGRMDFLIESILKLSRLGRSELRPEPVQTEQLLHALLKTLAHQIEIHRARVQLGPLPDLIIDRTAIERIFGNLLDNALKYLEPSRPGEIAITAEQKDGVVHFSFRDNGRGIAPDDIKKVFDPFRRVGNQDVPGEGMGLTYVKTLIKRLGGRIWCESEPGIGTTFRFSVPIKPGICAAVS